jgi:hypothetical protein
MSLVLRYLELLRFRGSPEFFPNSQSLLLIITILLWSASSLLQWLTQGSAVTWAPISPAISLLTYLVLLYGLLWLRSVPARFLRVAVAASGVRLLLELLLLPQVAVMHALNIQEHQRSLLFFNLTGYGALIWRVLVEAHILRLAGQWAWPLSLSAAVALEVLAFQWLKAFPLD